MNSVRIDVLGSSFSVQTDEDPAYFSELLSFYKSRIALVESQTRIKDPMRLSTLAALLMADELFKARARIAPKPEASGAVGADTTARIEQEEAERIALRLISALDTRLPE